ncbi:DUF523 domain-containing protein [Reinekea sp. G2M2-21]|uniref:DUF523 domain-containing protein n=1 Tax=Reinekea sp. G2M2-21 TaxID=2788942 RepID=UPI0018A9B84A
MKAKILISACLLGDRVRYDGDDNGVDSVILRQWQMEGRLVSVCPEVAGGLSIPRAPAEVQHGDGHQVIHGYAQIITVAGDDVTKAFLRGAQLALSRANEHGCRFAVLAARSPSCGNDGIYDGTFSHKLVAGMGVTAALLTEHHIEVFNQSQIAQLADRLAELEA